MSFADHFSADPQGYCRHRPGYPAALFQYLADLPRRRARAWDCGTGNGQAAVALAPHFDTVVASDASPAQLTMARAHPRVRYFAATAERGALRAGIVDLVTVAQALHWFDLEAFYAEVRRVLRPGGAVAAWCYGLVRVEPAVDACLDDFHGRVVGPWWPPERHHVDAAYATLPFPFEGPSPPGMWHSAEWDLEALLAYLGTWSAVRRYRDDRSEDPIAALRDRLAPLWGDAGQRRRVAWPLHLKAGRV